MTRKSAPLTVNAAFIWAVTTALIGWAGNRLVDSYTGHVDRLEQRVQSVEERLRNCK